MHEQGREARDERREAAGHPSVRTEKTDASLRWVAGTVIAAVVLGAIILSAVLGFFHAERSRLALARKSRFPLAPGPALTLPGKPRLEQVDRLAGETVADVKTRQAARYRLLQSYGATAEKGYVHIPIDRAMKLLVNRLPARDPSAAVRAVKACGALGLLSLPGPSGLAAAAVVFSLPEDVDLAAIDWRQNGLVNGGESNSGRMFRTRKTAWLER